MLLFILLLYNSKNKLWYLSHNKVDLYGISVQVDSGAQRCSDTWLPESVEIQRDTLNTFLNLAASTFNVF